MPKNSGPKSRSVPCLKALFLGALALKRAPKNMGSFILPKIGAHFSERTPWEEHKKWAVVDGKKKSVQQVWLDYCIQLLPVSVA